MKTATNIIGNFGMLVCFWFISNFLELLLGHTFRCHLLKSQRKPIENRTKLYCQRVFLAMSLLYSQGIFGRREGQRTHNLVLVRLYIALAIDQAGK